MQDGVITARAKRKVTDYGSDTRLIRAEHKSYDNSYKPTESSFAGKTVLKWHRIFSIQFSIIAWSTT